MNFHNISIEEVYRALNSNSEGLSLKEVYSRLENDGKNKFKDVKKESFVVKFLNQFKDLMIIVLLIAAVLSFIIAIIKDESILDSIIIVSIVIINAVLGLVQELKADKAIENLEHIQKTKVRVKREGKLYIVDSEDIVKGDILVLEAGDSIPADARIIRDVSLKVDESALTGESEPVEKKNCISEKNTSFLEMVNMIYQGTNVVYGKCEAIVCSTSYDTEFGKIADSLLQKEEGMTPIQTKINSISKVLSVIIAVIILIMIVIGIIKEMKMFEITMLAISLAVAAIPEGLPAVITIVLSIGANDLAKKNAIVRKISSVETLGSTEIICSDKTGTITQNKMTVQELVCDDKIIPASDIDINSLLVKSMVLNNDVTVIEGEYSGDPTEIALIDIIDNYDFVKELKENNKRVGELPFDSDRKMMSTINKDKDGITLFVKGSFDSVIERCSKYYCNNKIIKLTLKKKKELKELEIAESNKAYRLLCFAYKTLDDKYDINSNLEDDLIFLGLAAMIDPPRKDVKEAIQLCRKAHIRPIMITGDSLSTAKAIAKEVGILEHNSEVISGSDLDKMSFSELKRNVDKYSVYARVSPINKLDIVNAWKANNKIVAMTGDGVNDAPALKVANIGVGMGITGTEVSKSVSDIVLTDDSFSTIVTAVKEGRRIFDNIRNVLVYLLVGNIAEVIVVFICMAMGIEIFSPIQLLYINLITDSIPAIALAFEKEASDVMQRPVRRSDGTFFTAFLVAKISASAIIKTFAMLLVYSFNFKYYGASSASTITFLTLIFLEIIYAYSCKNLKNSVIDKNIFNNKVLNAASFALLLLQIIVFVTPVKDIFNITYLHLLQVLHSVCIVLLMFSIDEISKIIIVNKFKD